MNDWQGSDGNKIVKAMRVDQDHPSALYFSTPGRCYEALAGKVYKFDLWTVDRHTVEDPSLIDLEWIQSQAESEPQSKEQLALLVAGHAWTLPLIECVTESQILNYRIKNLVGFGADTLVFRAIAESGDVVAVKVPWHPESRCSSEEKMGARRHRLEHESRILKADIASCFPKFISLVRNHGISHFGSLVSRSPVLIEEFIDGDPLGRASVGSQPDSEEAGSKSWEDVLVELLRFGQDLSVHGYIYSDFRPSNMLLSPEGLRVVDAGSAARDLSGGLRRPRLTLSSLPHHVYRRAGMPDFRFTEGDAVATSARVMLSMVCRKAMVVGQPIEVSTHESESKIVRFLRRMEAGKTNSFRTALDIFDTMTTS